jgi:hypothetical protein
LDLSIAVDGWSRSSGDLPLNRLLLYNYMASLAELKAGYSLYYKRRRLWEERR